MRQAGALVVDALRRDEIAAAVALWTQCGLTRPWNDPEADARRALDGPASIVLAGRRDGRLTATAMVGADGHRAWVYYLAVAPERRGQGDGAAMMAAAEAWARARGMPKLQLMVRAENSEAYAFYRSIGYDLETVTVWSRRFPE